MIRAVVRGAAAVTAALAVACGGASSARGPDTVGPEPQARMVQPGAPGDGGQVVGSGDLSALGGLEHSEADVRFMQGMIPHHAQALEMTALVAERAADPGIHQLALRMEISQRDEIGLMERWLEARGESSGGGMDMAHRPDHDTMLMPGMLTPEQMARLKAASGVEFDRLFLEYMIQHHEGAIVMVADLFDSAGGGQESEIFQFASHVDSDQRMEIERMRRMLEQQP